MARRWRRLAPLAVVPLAWAVLVGAVAAIEVRSEFHKYDRGVSSDTFEPLLATRALALPGSAVANSVFPEGSRPEGKRHLAERAVTLVASAYVSALLVLACGVAALLALSALVRRTRRRGICPEEGPQPPPLVELEWR